MQTDDQPETTPGGHPGRPERPWWPAALAIGAFVIIVIGAGFFANARLRTPVGPVATATEAVPSDVPSTPLPTATMVAMIAPTLPPAATSASGATASLVTGTATPIIVPGSTTFFHYVTSSQDREIEKAYLHYWQVVSAAELNDDPTHLDEVMADPQLTLIRKYLQTLKAQGRGLQVALRHKPLGVGQVASNQQVQVYDEYVNASLYLDLKTNEVIPTKEPPQTLKFIYVLKKIDQTWKVTDGINVTG